MVGETVYGAARSRNFDLAIDLLDWASAQEILLRSEYRALARAVLACRTRLIRFAVVRNHVESMLAAFRAESWLGKVPCSEPLIHTASAVAESPC